METPCSIERLPKTTPTAVRRPGSANSCLQKTSLIVVIVREVIFEQDRVTRLRDAVEKLTRRRDAAHDLNLRTVHAGRHRSLPDRARVPWSDEDEDIAAGGRKRAQAAIELI